VNVTQGQTTATTRLRDALRLRPYTWTRIRCHSAIPTHMAKAIVRPVLRPRESQAPPALDCMERILESIERATSASSLQLQSFFGQGESIFYFVEIF
jgi:hypothetical protein